MVVSGILFKAMKLVTIVSAIAPKRVREENPLQRVMVEV